MIKMKLNDLLQEIYDEGFNIGANKSVQIKIAMNLLDVLNDETIAEKCNLSIYKVQYLRNIRDSIFNEGKESAQIKIAKNLLDILNDEIISDRCGLSIDKVKQLRNDLLGNKS